MRAVAEYRVIEERRREFPSLERTLAGHPLAFLDGPAGTQVPQVVIEAVADYYRNSNANTCGQFPTSLETDEMLAEARTVVATFLNATSSNCVSFGANMTTLCFALARAVRPHLHAGDEVLITQLDHEANRGPWVALTDMGVVVREVRLLPNGQLDEADMMAKVTDRTRLMAIGHASNFMGTVNNLALARQLTTQVGAWLVVDAVHSAPHFLLDVVDLDPDFLFCSAYKFYGPHVGILYSRPGLLDQLSTERLRTQTPTSPYRIETGTLNHASIAGVKAAVEFIASYGAGETLREKLASAYDQIGAYERLLARRLWSGLEAAGVTLYGPDFDGGFRAPTVAFRHRSRSPIEIAGYLGERGIQVWDGDFYAIRAAEILGVAHLGGVVRIGITLCNSQDDVDRLLESLAHLP